MIYISNWHTSYSELLSKVFKKAIIFRKWDFDQRDFPENFEQISLTKVFLKLKKGDTLILNKAIDDLPIIILALLKKVKVVIVLHGEITRNSSGIRLLFKRVFYDILRTILPAGDSSFVCIQKSVKDSFKFRNSNVIQPFAVLKEKSPINLNRSVVVGNNISRKHFNKDFLNYINKNIAPLTVIGRDNKSLTEKYPFNFITPNNKKEFNAELKKGGLAINCLMSPEASYNLGILDCIIVGMPLISIYREDLIFKEGSILINEKFNSYEKVIENLNNKSFIEKKIKILREIVEKEFSFEKFARNWENAIK